MYFTSDSMLPENQLPLVITVAPYGPQWLPKDCPEDIPVTWEETQMSVLDLATPDDAHGTVVA